MKKLVVFIKIYFLVLSCGLIFIDEDFKPAGVVCVAVILLSLFWKNFYVNLIVYSLFALFLIIMLVNILHEAYTLDQWQISSYQFGILIFTVNIFFTSLIIRFTLKSRSAFSD
jgi:hypothetical protein